MINYVFFGLLISSLIVQAIVFIFEVRKRVSSYAKFSSLDYVVSCVLSPAFFMLLSLGLIKIILPEFFKVFTGIGANELMHTVNDDRVYYDYFISLMIATFIITMPSFIDQKLFEKYFHNRFHILSKDSIFLFGAEFVYIAIWSVFLIILFFSIFSPFQIDGNEPLTAGELLVFFALPWSVIIPVIALSVKMVVRPSTAIHNDSKKYMIIHRLVNTVLVFLLLSVFLVRIELTYGNRLNMSGNAEKALAELYTLTLPAVTATMFTPVFFIGGQNILIQLRLKSESLEQQNKDLEESRNLVKALSVELMESLSAAIDSKDVYTAGHSQRVAQYSRLIAEKIGLPEEECENVYYYGLLHDVGKIGVPNAIINKPSKLTDEEFAVIKTHPGQGYDILSHIKSRPDLAIGAHWHHERVDGRGYPDHKRGDEIPFLARIIAVADAYDAMTSNRSYRQYLPQDVVRSEIEKGIGTQFDEQAAKCMLQVIDDDKEYKLHE